ncbi:protein RIK-like isoform X4 [Olea europaea var. sylvestris]|uniref:protein RIK-like isoform X4 n=1 Tax=Olea europaea var. sylvestris TaxID=158386 RepID=UPI000C1D432C|nr:protein RIK-like isoform X4 [Olea europaea var. sylvestris]
MVEEILDQGSVNNGVKVNPLLTACVFLGFEADPSLDISSRIRGPNDQYVNHIMSETGATVLLRGRRSGNSENALGEEAPQPLHLLLSSNDPIGLERAKLLAENLLDTISAECGASRASSCKVYVAVPPPPQLLGEVQNSGNESVVKECVSSSLTSSGGMTGDVSHGAGLQSMGLLNPGMPQASTVCHSHSSLIGGTSYIGYEGIYPQATPLQQVALALRQSTSSVTATVDPAAKASSAKSPTTVVPSEEKRPPQRRKFQELSAAAKGPATTHQVFSLTLYEAYRPIFTGFSDMEVAWDGHALICDVSHVMHPSTCFCFSSFQLPICCQKSRLSTFLFFHLLPFLFH